MQSVKYYDKCLNKGAVGMSYFSACWRQTCKQQHVLRGKDAACPYSTVSGLQVIGWCATVAPSDSKGIPRAISSVQSERNQGWGWHGSVEKPQPYTQSFLQPSSERPLKRPCTHVLERVFVISSPLSCFKASLSFRLFVLSQEDALVKFTQD